MISRKQLLTLAAALTAGAIATPLAVAQSSSGTSGAGVGGSLGYSSGPGMPDSSYSNSAPNSPRSGVVTTSPTTPRATADQRAPAGQTTTSPQSTSRWGENQHVARGEDGRSRFDESTFGTLNERRSQENARENRDRRDDDLGQLNRTNDPLTDRSRDPSDNRAAQRSTDRADADRRAGQLESTTDEGVMSDNESDAFDGDAYAYGLDGQD